LITTTYVEPRARTRALIFWGATAATGGAFGAMTGGLLTDALSWRWVLVLPRIPRRAAANAEQAVVAEGG
jgi:MFS family permease